MAKVDGGRGQGATPLLEHELARIVATLGESPREIRDRAMLLLGFAGAYRSAELAALRVDDVTFHPDGLSVRIARSKEEQLGKGAHTRIPRGRNLETCPVEALSRGMGVMGRPAGPLFRVIEGAHRAPAHQRARCVSRRAARVRAGLDGRYCAQ